MKQKMKSTVRTSAILLATPIVITLAGCGSIRHSRTVLVDDPSYQPTTAPQTGSNGTNGQAAVASTGDTASFGNSNGSPGENSNLSTNQPGARLWGDAPAAGLNSDIDKNSFASASFNGVEGSSQAGTSTDARLGVFGEVDGVGGLPGEFGALESIQRISFADEGADFDPSIDQTGQYLLYASTQHGKTADIYRKKVHGTTVTRLTTDPADDIMPAFSPDNQHIAFSSNRSGNWDLYVMDSDGGQSVRLTNDSQHELHPTWSPDGKYIVYSRLSEASGRWEMWMTEFANPASRKFLGYGLFPSWSPDPAQNKIVYQEARERGSRLFSIWTIDIVNGEGRTPTEIASAANAAAVNPSWSADGKMLAFATIIDPQKQNPDHPKEADIWVIGLDGTGRVNLTNGKYTNLQPCWGPDGEVFFVSNRSGVDNIWALRPDDAIKTARGGVAGPIGRKTDLAEVSTNGQQ